MDTDTKGILRYMIGTQRQQFAAIRTSLGHVALAYGFGKVYETDLFVKIFNNTDNAVIQSLAQTAQWYGVNTFLGVAYGSVTNIADRMLFREKSVDTPRKCLFNTLIKAAFCTGLFYTMEYLTPGLVEGFQDGQLKTDSTKFIADAGDVIFPALAATLQIAFHNYGAYRAATASQYSSPTK